MTPPPLPMKGRNDGVYGFLDGNRGFLGVFLHKLPTGLFTLKHSTLRGQPFQANHQWEAEDF